MSELSSDEIEFRVYEMKRRFPYQFAGELFAYEFPTGWINIFGLLCCALDHLLIEHGYTTEAKKRDAFTGWSQVKTKLAGARTYSHSVNLENNQKAKDAYFALIDAVEDLSRSVCEGCGAKGKWRSVSGWLVTACDQHYEEWQKERDRY